MFDEKYHLYRKNCKIATISKLYHGGKKEKITNISYVTDKYDHTRLYPVHLIICH